jgi:predicted kinase
MVKILRFNTCGFWQDQILLFDCIEFNPAFRFVDVMYDLAYGVMDLDVNGRSDLATVYLNQYLEITGDWEGVLILPIYLSRQAYVRAKVISFLLDDPAISEPLTISQKAAAYYRLAWNYLHPKTGSIWLMSGLSGSGKTTVARYLAKQTGAIHIRSDAVRKHLAGIPLSDRGGSEVYSAAMTEKTYTRLQALGLQLANAGYTVILDAKYDRQTWRSQVRNAALSQGIQLHMIHCEAPLAVLQARLQQRTQDIADATADHLIHQQWDPFTPEEESCSFTLDTTQNWQASLTEILSRG